VPQLPRVARLLSVQVFWTLRIPMQKPGSSTTGKSSSTLFLSLMSPLHLPYLDVSIYFDCRQYPTFSTVAAHQLEIDVSSSTQRHRKLRLTKKDRSYQNTNSCTITPTPLTNRILAKTQDAFAYLDITLFAQNIQATRPSCTTCRNHTRKPTPMASRRLIRIDVPRKSIRASPRIYGAFQRPNGPKSENHGFQSI
jgi:hypothetical protein